MKSYKNIILSVDKKGIAKIILAEPSTYNALSFKTILSLLEIFKKLNLDNKVKVIIIEGQGKGFCAGHDLKEIRGLKGKSAYQRLFNKCSELMLNIVNHKKPVIAKIHGAAFAAGCQLDLGLIVSCSGYPHPNWRAFKNYPPLIISHGRMDEVVPINASRKIYEEVKKISDNSCNLYEFDGSHQIDCNLINIVNLEIKKLF